MMAFFAVGLVAGSVHAEPTAEQRAVAEALFREAKQLLRKNEVAEACRKLEESQRLDPRDGTLLNLAVCHEKEGKVATAWVEFQEALAAARTAKRWDRIQLAQRRIKELEKQVPHLTVEVTPGATVQGFELQRDDVPLAEATWGTRLPVDPGEHTLRASAPGMQPWSTVIVLNLGDDPVILVPKLEPVPPPPAPKPTPKPKPKPPPPPPASPSSQRIGAYIAGGVGVIGLGIGSYYGLRAISKSDDSESHCNGVLCDPTGLEQQDDAASAARVSNVAFTIGLVGIGVGATLWLTEPSSPEASKSGAARPAIHCTAIASGGTAAMLVRGAW